MVLPKHPLEKQLGFNPTKLAGPGRSGGHKGAPVKRAQTILGKGPEYLTKANIPLIGSGPQEPPPGFVTPTTSATEWNVYWALAKIYGDPQNPRLFPFFGPKIFWGYQIDLSGGRSQGGAVADFLVYDPPSRRRLAIRVVTQYFHLGLGSGKIAKDDQQKAALLQYVDVYDLFDTEVVGDTTGEKSVIAVKKALQMIPNLDPVMGGTALPNRQL